MKSARLLRSSTFRLALLYIGLFGLSVLMLMGYIYWTTAGFMERQTRETIAAETRGLAEQYRLLGLTGLIRIINARVTSDRSRNSLYLLADKDLLLLAGNLPSWPTAELEAADVDGGWMAVTLPALDDDKHGRKAILRHFRLAGDFNLLVGRNVSDRYQVQQLIINSLFYGLGMCVILGLVGGVVMSRSLLARIETINKATREIIAGDLGRRIPTEGTPDGSNDEFDQLAVNLNRMLDRIEELLDAVRRVSDNIAHDLRTPLNRLRSRLEVALLERPVEPEQDAARYRQAIEETIAESENILATFNALLTIAQVEAGSPREDVHPLDMAVLAGDVADLYSPLAEDKEIILRTDLQPGLVVTGNRHLLSQAMANLLDNAIKYTPRGGRVLLSLTRLDHGCEFMVCDSGPGIPAAEREQVLKRFYRVESSRSTPGSGLGLSLVAAVAGLYGAELILDDAEPGENPPGLCITMVFPSCMQTSEAAQALSKASD